MKHLQNFYQAKRTLQDLIKANEVDLKISTMFNSEKNHLIVTVEGRYVDIGSWTFKLDEDNEDVLSNFVFVVTGTVASMTDNFDIILRHG